ncbi:MAG: hypothetical protein WCR30_04740 [Clostridia bacterium]
MNKSLKNILKCLATLGLIAIVLTLGYFCQNNFDLIKEILSDERTIYFEGEAEKTFASFTSGVREEPYEQDGAKEDMVEFGIIKTKFSLATTVLTFDFVLKVGEEEISGTMEKSPYENAYYFDIEKKVDSETPIILSFTVSGIPDTEITLNNVSTSWIINSDEALKIATKQIENKKGFKKIFAGTKIFDINSKNLECHLQILSNDSPLLTSHFWYFVLLSESGEIFSCVIDPSNGNILAQS